MGFGIKIPDDLEEIFGRMPEMQTPRLPGKSITDPLYEELKKGNINKKEFLKSLELNVTQALKGQELSQNDIILEICAQLYYLLNKLREEEPDAQNSKMIIFISETLVASPFSSNLLRDFIDSIEKAFEEEKQKRIEAEKERDKAKKELEEKTLFRNKRSDDLTTTISTISEKKGEFSNYKVDDITATATFEKLSSDKKFKTIVSIPDYLTKGKYNVSTGQVFDTLVIAYTDYPSKDNTVNIKLDDYMEIRDLSDKKSAINQIVSGLNLLVGATISKACLGSGEKGDPVFDKNAILIGKSGHYAKGNIEFTFDPEFVKLLNRSSVALYPTQALSANTKRNPHTPFLLITFTSHKFQNSESKQGFCTEVSEQTGWEPFEHQYENRIKVSTLIEKAPGLSEQQVKESNRDYTKRIMEPLMRDLDACFPTISEWHLLRKETKVEAGKNKLTFRFLTDEELETLNYEMFKELYVEVVFPVWPDQSKRLQRKNERIQEHAKNKKEEKAKENKKRKK